MPVWGRKRSLLRILLLQSSSTPLSPQLSSPLCAPLAPVNSYGHTLKLDNWENYAVPPVLPVPCLHPGPLPAAVGRGRELGAERQRANNSLVERG